MLLLVEIPSRPAVLDIARFFVELAVAEARGEKISRRKEKKLKTILHLLALVAASQSRMDVYQTDPTYTGYVYRRLDRCDLYVPFHLCKYFPSDRKLDEIVSAANGISMIKEDPICISGSTTFLESWKSISDLDFCEYHIRCPGNYIQDEFEAKLMREERHIVFCSVHVQTSHSRPWDFGALKRDLIVLLSSSEQPAIMIRAIYISSLSGFLPTSNLVLFLNPADLELGSARKTFVFQEAVLVKAGGPPRTLVSPRGLGGYLNFLREQSEALLRTDPLKSLKRSLCFFLMTTQWDPAAAIMRVLQSSAAELVIRSKRQKELDSLFETLPPDVAAATRTPQPDGEISPDQVAYVHALIHPLLESFAAAMLERIGWLYAGQSE